MTLDGPRGLFHIDGPAMSRGGKSSQEFSFERRRRRKIQMGFFGIVRK